VAMSPETRFVVTGSTNSPSGWNVTGSKLKRGVVGVTISSCPVSLMRVAVLFLSTVIGILRIALVTLAVGVALYSLVSSS
jgi:hypothetical protein